MILSFCFVLYLLILCTNYGILHQAVVARTAGHEIIELIGGIANPV